MDDFSIRIPGKYSGKEIKFILKNHFRLSDRMITRLKKDDGIMLNGNREFVTKTVTKGDMLVLNLPSRASENIVPKNLPLSILYEDEHILAANKPSGMPTHPSLRHYEDTLANACAYYFRSIPFTFRAITRLDRDTTGVVIIAKNAPAAQRLSLAMQTGGIRKEYIALCCGVPEPESGSIDAPIKRENAGIMKRCVSPEGRPAVTEYETAEQKDGYSLVRLIPHTGRTHQLRVHLAHIGVPIYGDFLYGTEIPGERTRLHCRSVSFMHPFTGKNMTVSAPLPDDMHFENIKAD